MLYKKKRILILKHYLFIVGTIGIFQICVFNIHFSQTATYLFIWITLFTVFYNSNLGYILQQNTMQIKIWLTVW